MTLEKASDLFLRLKKYYAITCIGNYVYWKPKNLDGTIYRRMTFAEFIKTFNLEIE